MRDPCAVDGIVSIGQSEVQRSAGAEREAEKAESRAFRSIQGERGRCMDDARRTTRRAQPVQ